VPVLKLAVPEWYQGLYLGLAAMATGTIHKSAVVRQRYCAMERALIRARQECDMTDQVLTLRNTQ